MLSSVNFLGTIFLGGVILSAARGTMLSNKVIIAVNAGGPAHRDVFGVNYAADILEEGQASDFGKRYDIQRIPVIDGILYQTERYTTEMSFGYEIPLKKDGNYVLVLKFSEVYFKAPGHKVFNVLLNEDTILSHLDIFREVGLATAHEELIPFTVKNNGRTLKVHDSESSIRNGKVDLVFQRGLADNPKINAFAVIQGTLHDIPKLPPLVPPNNHQPNEIEDEDDDSIFEDEDNEEINLHGANVGSDNEDKNLQKFNTGQNKRVRSGPSHFDPWDEKSSNDKWLPVGIAAISGILASVLLSTLLKKSGQCVKKEK